MRTILDLVYDGQQAPPDASKARSLRSFLTDEVIQRASDAVQSRGPDFKLRELSYAELTDLLSKLFSPRVNVIAERFKFNQVSQTAEMSIKEFQAALESAAKTCGFGDSYDEQLRDRFVLGVRSPDIQTALLAEGANYEDPKEYKLAKAVSIAEGREEAKISARGIQETMGGAGPSYSPDNVNALRKKPSATATCSRCGAASHRRENCRVPPDVECRFCHKTGHVEKACLGAQEKSREANPPASSMAH